MRRIDIVGAGPGALDLMPVVNRALVGECDLLIGAPRLLDACASLSSAPRVSAVRAEDIVRELEGATWQRACVVMSGDTGMFSGTTSLLEHIRRASSLAGCRVRVHPAPGSAALLAARLGRPWQDWRFLSAHGVELDYRELFSSTRPAYVVTAGGQGPSDICRALDDAGWGDARVTVAQNLSYEDESIETGLATDLLDRSFAPLTSMLIEFPREVGIPWPFDTPGIPDEAFERGRVPMTKREVRAVALSKLRVARGDVVYDIGSGTGSVTVELARVAGPAGRVFAFERNPEAVELTRRNIRAFRLRNVRVVEGAAPQVLEGCPAPDAVFVGGSAGMLGDIVQTLRASGARPRLCVPCVSLETLSSAVALLGGPGFSGLEVCEVSVARAQVTGSHHLMRANNPVFLIAAQMTDEDGRVDADGGAFGGYGAGADEHGRCS